jgi:hypothetical protein
MLREYKPVDEVADAGIKIRLVQILQAYHLLQAGARPIHLGRYERRKLGAHYTPRAYIERLEYPKLDKAAISIPHFSFK